MSFEIMLILVAIGLWLYVTTTAIDLGKGLRAALANQTLPVYFELFPRRLPNQYEQYLIKNDKFYGNLSPKLQRSYGSRIMNFIDDKTFKTRDALKITGEMKLVIASIAVKITFGLREYLFGHFHTIIIYSGEFHSNVSGLDVKGETNGAGVIVFSWEDLQYGNSIPDDSINLGYHEFAHALFLGHLMNPYNNGFKDHYREWLMFVKYNDKLDEVREKHIFRDYAAVNEMEFFAVALENFFEKPNHFKQQLPQLYKLMVQMLNQDLATV